MRNLPPSAVYLLFLSLASTVHASAQDNHMEIASCMTSKELEQSIQYCEDNIYAALSADQCMRQSQIEWDAAAEQLAILETSTNSQRGETQASEVKYQNSIKKVSALVRTMQARVAWMEGYPRVMVDDREIMNGNPSLRCYQENLAKVQKSVNNVEDKVIRGLRMLQKFGSLRYHTAHNRELLEDDSRNAMADSFADEAESAQGLDVKGSDISETTRKKPTPK